MGSLYSKGVDLKKVLFISTTKQEQLLVEEVAKNHDKGREFVFETTASFGQDRLIWAQVDISTLVIKIPDDEILAAFFMTKIRQDLPKTIPILLLSSQITQSLLALSAQFSKIRTLKTPADGFVIYRAILDISTDWKKGQQQIHPRYLTEQVITLTKFGETDPAGAVMRNLSVGGAYFESNDPVLKLKSQDLVKIHIEVSAEKVYEFDAQIVWIRPASKPGGVRGYGCTFLDADGVYQSLMKGI